jgi:hypothetical protein
MKKSYQRTMSWTSDYIGQENVLCHNYKYRKIPKSTDIGSIAELAG